MVRNNMKDWRTKEDNEYVTQMCSETNTLRGKIYFDKSQYECLTTVRDQRDINSNEYPSQENSHYFLHNFQLLPHLQRKTSLFE